MVSAIIVAAGRGERMQAGMNKVFMDLDGKSVVEHTIVAMSNSVVDELIIVASVHEIDKMRKIADKYSPNTKIVRGGEDRQQSVFNALNAATGDIVCIHDGARCLITPEIINNVIEDCKKYGAATVGVNCKDTMKLIGDDGYISSTIYRDKLYMIQTPQVFYKEKILEYHNRAKCDNLKVTDDSSLYELYGGKVYISEGSYENIKITTPDDYFIALEILKRRKTNA